jgi:hypothetical protein
MTQAIETKYIGPTNTKGARIKASAWAGSVTIPYDYSGTEKAHWRAALALIEKYGWEKSGWVMGGNAKTTGFCFVRNCELNSTKGLNIEESRYTNSSRALVKLSGERR